MHLVAPEVGLMGTSAMVATGIPLAVGAAIAFTMQGQGQVAAVFFGDGAAEEGAFHESLNLAAFRKAPVIFVCENNLYSSHVHLRDRRPANNLVEIAESNCITALSLDGNDVAAVYQATHQAVTRAREGQSPSFIECRTYRWRGHVGPNYDLEKGLRSPAELDEWMARCPIKTLETRLISNGLLTKTEAEQRRSQVAGEVAEAIALARQSSWPDPAELTEFVFKPRSTPHA